MSIASPPVTVPAYSSVPVDAPNSTLAFWAAVQVVNQSPSILVLDIRGDQVLLGPQTVTFVPLAGGTLSITINNSSAVPASVSLVWYPVGAAVPSQVTTSALNTSGNEQLVLFNGTVGFSTAAVATNNTLAIPMIVHAVAAYWTKVVTNPVAYSGLAPNTRYGVEVTVSLGPTPPTAASPGPLVFTTSGGSQSMLFSVATDANGDVAVNTVFTLEFTGAQLDPTPWIWPGSDTAYFSISAVGSSLGGFTAMPANSQLEAGTFQIIGFIGSVPQPRISLLPLATNSAVAVQNSVGPASNWHSTSYTTSATAYTATEIYIFELPSVLRTIAQELPGSAQWFAGPDDNANAWGTNANANDWVTFDLGPTGYYMAPGSAVWVKTSGVSIATATHITWTVC